MCSCVSREGSFVTARHPLFQLTRARFVGFLREPEAVFWVFAFPVIMTCALGIAFRSSAGQAIIVGGAQQVASAEVGPALEAAGGFTIRAIPPGEIESAVRDGRAPVVVEAGTPPVYHFD